MTTHTHEQILADLAGIVRDFNGKEYSGDVTPETLFFADLGMVSIDAVILAETLERHYGKPLPFQEFLAELGRRGARDVSIGELVDFLHRNL